MTVRMDIQVADDLSESIEEPPPSSQLLAWAQAAWQGDQDAEPELSLRIVSAAESQQLNNDYRGKNNPTNVLSFPMQIDEELMSHVGVSKESSADGFDHSLEDESLGNYLGDLAICAAIVESEALQQNKTRESHWAHMIVHGMLHLQGYDHIEDDEAEEMEQLETQIMQTLGFSDPYQMNSKLNNTLSTGSKS